MYEPKVGHTVISKIGGLKGNIIGIVTEPVRKTGDNRGQCTVQWAYAPRAGLEHPSQLLPIVATNWQEL
jgi:hypothetical protein